MLQVVPPAAQQPQGSLQAIPPFLKHRQAAPMGPPLHPPEELRKTAMKGGTVGGLKLGAEGVRLTSQGPLQIVPTEEMEA